VPRIARARGLLLTFVLAVVVSAFAAAFARFFRESIFFVLERLGGNEESTVVARNTSRIVVFVLVTSGLLVAAWLGRLAVRLHRERLGLAAVADAARGAGTGPSVSGTLVRSSGTWLAMASLASLGREAAILETGGSFGSWLGHKLKRPPADLAVTGIAAAFAAAYHAPIGGFLFVREHVVHRPERRTVGCALAGGVFGYLISKQFLGGTTIFARGSDPLGLGSFAHAAVALVPALVATRLFFVARQRVTNPRKPTMQTKRLWLRSIAFALVGGATVALLPLTSGNGMEAIRRGADLKTATIGLGLTLCIGKFVATAAALGSGAPGGVFSPSMAVASGAALMSFEALNKMGVALSGSHWDGMLAAMSVGIAVGTQTPLVGVIVVAELAGDARLIPVCAMSVAGAKLIEVIVRRIRPTRRVELSIDAIPLDG
jgi:CIC family chloride channel protein